MEQKPTPLRGCPSIFYLGESCGLVKNLALLTHVTSDEDNMPIQRMCYNLGMEGLLSLRFILLLALRKFFVLLLIFVIPYVCSDIELFSGEELALPYVSVVMLDGRLVGVHRHAAEFTRNFRLLRRRGTQQLRKSTTDLSAVAHCKSHLLQGESLPLFPFSNTRRIGPSTSPQTVR
jgi:DNA-directed RNA polymerase beta subunit